MLKDAKMGSPKGSARNLGGQGCIRGSSRVPFDYSSTAALGNPTWRSAIMPDRFDKLWNPRDASATRLQTAINNVGSDPKMPSKSITGDLSVKPFDYVNKASLS